MVCAGFLRAEETSDGIKIEQSSVVQAGGQAPVAVMHGNVAVNVPKHMDDKKETTGVSLKRSGATKADSAVKELRVPSGKWRKHTVNMAKSSDAQPKVKDSQELSKMEKHRKDRRAAVKKSLDAQPDRAKHLLKKTDDTTDNSHKGDNNDGGNNAK